MPFRPSDSSRNVGSPSLPCFRRSSNDFGTAGTAFAALRIAAKDRLTWYRLHWRESTATGLSVSDSTGAGKNPVLRGSCFEESMVTDIEWTWRSGTSVAMVEIEPSTLLPLRPMVRGVDHRTMDPQRMHPRRPNHPSRCWTSPLLIAGCSHDGGNHGLATRQFFQPLSDDQNC